MLLNRVRHYIRAQGLFSAPCTVVAAVSGGPDSLCLLHILRRLGSEYSMKIIVAHLNHSLRPEAGEEAAAVARVAAEWALPFESLTVDIRRLKKDLSVSEEVAGRLARYRFLFELARRRCATHLALGHHRDDQAETVLFKIIRGTGVDGLAGMLPCSRRGGVKVVRPLLCLTRKDIENYCRENFLQPTTDSSNLLTEYTRNKLRLELIPMLEEHYNPGLREVLARLGSLAAADRDYLQERAHQALAGIAREAPGLTALPLSAFNRLPRALQGRMLQHLLRKHAPEKEVGWKQVDQVLALAGAGKTGSRVGIAGGVEAYLDYNRLVIGTAGGDCSTFEPLLLAVPGRATLPRGEIITSRVADSSDLKWPPPPARAYLDADLVPRGSLCVRPRMPGDRFHPQGAAGRKKLKDFLIDKKISRFRRDALPLVAAGQEIIWVAGVRIAHQYRLTGRTKRVLVLEYRMRKKSFKAD